MRRMRRTPPPRGKGSSLDHLLPKNNPHLHGSRRSCLAAEAALFPPRREERPGERSP
jgi:hypothetical protein